MRIWKAIEPPKDIDSRIYEILKRLNQGAAQTSKAVNNITNTITVIGQSPDLTNYFYLPGRATGQTGIGNNASTDPGPRKGLYLQGFNLFTGTVSARSSRLEMEQTVVLRTSSLLICERDSTYTKGWQVSTGANFANVTQYGNLTINPASSVDAGTFKIDNTGGPTAPGRLAIIKKKSGQTGNYIEFQDNTSTALSSVRCSDGAWVGPIASSSSSSFVDSLFSLVDNGDNTKVLQFELSGITTGTTRTLTVPNANGTIALLGLAQTWSAAQTFPDNAFLISGSADATKLVAFEVDGLTTATTRTLTVQDLSGTLLVGGSTITNQVDAINATSMYALRTNLATLTGAASGSIVLFQVATTGQPTYSSGSYNLFGLQFNPTITFGSSQVLTTIAPIEVNMAFGNATGATYTTYAGIRSIVRRAAANGGTFTNIFGFYSAPSTMNTASTLVAAYHCERATTPTNQTYGGGAATDGVAFNIDSTFLASSAVTTWSGLRIPSISGPGTIWGLNITGTMNNQIAGKLALGGAATPAHWLDLAAGTTTVAPIRMAPGTNLTAAVAGCHEYDGALFYLTHSDAVRTAIPTRRATLDLTAQTAAIGATTLYAAPAAGYYVVHYTLEDTTADLTAGTIQFQVNYTDDVGATNQTSAALVLTATGRTTGSFQVYMNAVGNIQYQTNLTGIFGTSQYALRVRLEHLG